MLVIGGLLPGAEVYQARLPSVFTPLLASPESLTARVHAACHTLESIRCRVDFQISMQSYSDVQSITLVTRMVKPHASGTYDGHGRRRPVSSPARLLRRLKQHTSEHATLVTSRDGKPADRHSNAGCLSRCADGAVQ